MYYQDILIQRYHMAKKKLLDMVREKIRLKH